MFSFLQVKIPVKYEAWSSEGPWALTTIERSRFEESNLNLTPSDDHTFLVELCEP